tara:strand:+ start:193 stop:411 length:219 start_codon:yes stop_codon:yes gene_type:complete
MAETDQSIFKIPLIREITLVLVIKLVLVFVIKWSFFSDPVDMQNPQEVLDKHIGVESLSESNILTPRRHDNG